MRAGRPRRLYRSRSDRIIAGVCSGIGRYVRVDPVAVRFIWVVGILLGGVGVLAYLLAWLIIPSEP